MNSFGQVNPVCLPFFLLLAAVLCCAGWGFEAKQPAPPSQRSITEKTQFYNDIENEIRGASR
jgi:hypothetical protein